MKIDGVSSKSVSSSGSRTVGGANGKPAASSVSSGAGAKTDSVQINAAAARLAAAEANLDKIPAVDAAKVAAIKQAIAEGRLQVNAHAVASGLIDTVKDLLLHR